MLLNFLWFGLILLAFVSDLLTGMPFSSGMDGLSGARAGLELALTLAGPVCLWSGLSQAMERAGLTEGLCTALRPVLRRLFPVCAKDLRGLLEPVRQSERESAGVGQRGDAARHPDGAADAGAVRRRGSVG